MKKVIYLFSHLGIYLIFFVSCEISKPSFDYLLQENKEGNKLVIIPNYEKYSDYLIITDDKVIPELVELIFNYGKIYNDIREHAKKMEGRVYLPRNLRMDYEIEIIKWLEDDENFKRISDLIDTHLSKAIRLKKHSMIAFSFPAEQKEILIVIDKRGIFRHHKLNLSENIYILDNYVILDRNRGTYEQMIHEYEEILRAESIKSYYNGPKNANIIKL
jgi:hypothetical protein